MGLAEDIGKTFEATFAQSNTCGHPNGRAGNGPEGCIALRCDDCGYTAFTSATNAAAWGWIDPAELMTEAPS